MHLTGYVKMYSEDMFTLIHLKMSHCSMETVMSALLLTQVCSRGQNRLSGLFHGHVEEEEEARSLPNRNRVLRLCFPHLRTTTLLWETATSQVRLLTEDTQWGFAQAPTPQKKKKTHFCQRLIYKEILIPLSPLKQTSKPPNTYFYFFLFFI